MPAGHLQRRHMQHGLDLRIGAVGQQKLHQDDVAGLGCAQESRRAVLIQPLVREHRTGLRAVLHPGIDIGPVVQKELDEIQMIHVRLADRIISGFDIAVVRSQIKRRPAALVGEIHVGAVVQQIRSELVVPVLRRDQQGAPAVSRDLVHVRSGRQQDFDGIEIVGANRIHQRRQLAAIFHHRSSTAESAKTERSGCGVVGKIPRLIGAVRACSRSTPAASAAAATPLRPSTTGPHTTCSPMAATRVQRPALHPEPPPASWDRWISPAPALFRAPPDSTGL